ncbi:SsrA-binding protein SmpB [Candidatus Saccharibacteria bacterium]|nr:SsrA-binding protein SmpB [Candidatus Saccharibacteria bacterium]
MKTTKGSKILNPRARYDYELGDEIIAGIVLSGKETKALRQGKGNLRGSFVNLKDGELFLVNATITDGKTFTIPDSQQTRTRKLLVNKKQLKIFIEAKEQGKTIVPIEILTRGRYIKIKIAPGKGKKRYDKRQAIKKRDQMRDAQRSIK